MTINVVFVIFFIFVYTTEAQYDIPGGYEVASPEKFPYHLSIRNSHAEHIGSGCLISNRWVLTAAHCVMGTDPLFVVAGTIDITMEGGTTSEILKVIPHEDYSTHEIAFDIALLNIERLEFTDTIQPVSIGSGSPYVGMQLIATGWGVRAGTDYRPEVLQFYYTSVLSHSYCTHLMFPRKVYSNNICTILYNKDNMCWGDEGGPLVAGGAVYGLMGWNDENCEPGYADIHTRVPKFHEWILSHTKPR